MGKQSLAAGLHAFAHHKRHAPTAAERLQDVIVSERRFQYEAEVSSNPLNYDTWFDYVRLEEAAGDPERVSFGSFYMRRAHVAVQCGASRD